MKKQVRVAEMAAMVASPLIAFIVHILVRMAAEPLQEGVEGLGGLAIALVFVAFLPSLAAVAAGSLLQSARYRAVNIGLATFAVVVHQVLQAIRIVTGWQALAVWSVFVAFSMGAALLVGLGWKVLSAKSAGLRARLGRPERQGQASPVEPLASPPRTSRFLTGLALVSIPIVIINIVASTFITLGLAAALLFILLQEPRIPLVLLAGAALAPLAALWATGTALLALFRPAQGEEPATLLEREGQAEVYRAADEVARQTGAKPADRIILHLMPTFYVAQARIGLLEGSANGRILALGMPALRDLSGRELRAVLAHEFAHFAEGDVLYSTVVAPAYRGLRTALVNLSRARAEGGMGSVMDVLRIPAVFFLSSSYEYFATIDRALQRGRELRADRVAAGLYGRESFLHALEKVATRSALYARLGGDFRLSEPTAFFAEAAAHLDADASVGAAIREELLAEQEEALDSHPSYSTRAAALPDLPGSVPAEASLVVPDLGDAEARLSSLAVERLHLPLAGAGDGVVDGDADAAPGIDEGADGEAQSTTGSSS